MTPKELASLAEKTFGADWKKALAAKLQVNSSTVRRWLSGAVPIPGPAEAAIRCLYCSLKR